MESRVKQSTNSINCVSLASFWETKFNAMTGPSKVRLQKFRIGYALEIYKIRCKDLPVATALDEGRT